jgi:Trypsin-like peptidase domain
MVIVIESLLLAITRVTTLNESGGILTNATGFFYEDEGRLFLVTNRHVILSEDTEHRPTSLSIELHVDAENISATTDFKIPLYQNEVSAWKEWTDSVGLIDVATIELERDHLPKEFIYEAFTKAHLVLPQDLIPIGTSVLIVGFPLGFHDSLHHLPVARQAIVASSYGLRFQGNGYFLTDARLHRGTSGAPVVAAVSPSSRKVGTLPWMLLGVHSARLDADQTDLSQDDRLGLNCAWYGDVLQNLSELAESPAPLAAPAITDSRPTHAAPR